MYVTKCDACGMEIDKKMERYMFYGYRSALSNKALCDKCAAPIIAILEEKGLLKKQDSVS